MKSSGSDRDTVREVFERWTYLRVLLGPLWFFHLLQASLYIHTYIHTVRILHIPCTIDSTVLERVRIHSIGPRRSRTHARARALAPETYFDSRGPLLDLLALSVYVLRPYTYDIYVYIRLNSRAFPRPRERFKFLGYRVPLLRQARASELRAAGRATP